MTYVIGGLRFQRVSGQRFEHLRLENLSLAPVHRILKNEKGNPFLTRKNEHSCFVLLFESNPLVLISR